MIIYKKNIVQTLKEAGYNTNRIRKENLFSQSTLTKFNNNDTSITLNNLSVVCELLNCQPSDLIEYIPNEKE